MDDTWNFLETMVANNRSVNNDIDLYIWSISLLYLTYQTLYYIIGDINEWFGAFGWIWYVWIGFWSKKSRRSKTILGANAIMNIILYTKENCAFCTKAKMLLSSKGINYTELKLNEDFSRENLLELYPSAKTFPVIVVDGFNIGGFTNLQVMINNQPQDSRKFLAEG